MTCSITPSHEEGFFGRFGGAFVPEVLLSEMNKIAKAYAELKDHPDFIRQMTAIRKSYQGRPTPVTYAKNLTAKTGGAQIYLKREDLNHTGAHKINHCIGSVVGPHPFPTMVRDFQSIVGHEARSQMIEETGKLPHHVVACVGGGSNAMGIFSGFLKDDCVRLYGVEPLGKGTKLGQHAASITFGSEGVMHGFNSLMLKDEKGEPASVYSIASGLDYPSVGPEHAFLHTSGRVKYAAIDDRDCLDAFYTLSRTDGIIPALESAHAVAYAMKLAREVSFDETILVNLSGRGDKDIDFVLQTYGLGK